MKLPIPANEEARLEALDHLHILDTPPEPEFDELAHLAARICGTPIAQVNLVVRNHVWAKANIGFPERTLTRVSSFCAYTVGEAGPVVIPDTYNDERTKLLPSVVQGPKIRFYAGIPLNLKGHLTVGSLCVMDLQPRQIDLEQLGALQTLARQVEAHLELRKILKTSAAADGTPASAAHQSEHMGMMTDQIPAAVWSVDLDLRFTSAFGASTTTINMDPNQVLGRTLFDYFRTQAIEYAPLAAHVRAMHGETTGPMRWQVGPRTFEVHIESLRNDQRTVIGAVGIAVDISERAAMEETVVEAEARVRTLAEQVSGSVPIGSEAKETGDGTVISLVG